MEFILPFVLLPLHVLGRIPRTKAETSPTILLSRHHLPKYETCQKRHPQIVQCFVIFFAYFLRSLNLHLIPSFTKSFIDNIRAFSALRSLRPPTSTHSPLACTKNYCMETHEGKSYYRDSHQGCKFTYRSGQSRRVPRKYVLSCSRTNPPGKG